MMPSNKLQNEEKVESSEAKSLESKIQIACLNRNDEEAIKLLDEVETLNVKKRDEKGVLYIAVDNGNDILVKKLLEIGANPDFQNKTHKSVLHLASEKGDPKIVSLLLNYGAKISVKVNSQYSPLHIAVSKKHIPVVELLLAKGANPDEKKVYGPLWSNTPLGRAIQIGNHALVQKLLEHNANPNIQCMPQRYPLEKASEDGHVEIVKLLLKYGADIEQGNEDLGHTPLHSAADNGCYDVAKVLLENGAKVDSRGIGYDTPLHIAVMSDRLEVLPLLLEHNANVNALDESGVTPLLRAVIFTQIYQEEIVDALLENGCDVNIKEPNYLQIAIHRSVNGGSLWTFSQLLRYGSDVNAKDSEGYTTLHLMVLRSGQSETKFMKMRELLRQGHDFD